MKKGVYCLFLLLMLPIASAELLITSEIRDSYNIGDKVFLEGNIKSDETEGILSFVLHCENTSIQIAAKTITIDKEALFSQQMQIPNTMTGICSIYASLISNSNKTETSSTREFIITKALTGNFEINKNEFQLGDDIVVTGDIKRVDGSDAVGSVTIYLKKNDINYVIDNAELSGQFNYTTKAVALPPGQYTIDISSLDQNGNEMSFEDALVFQIYNELYINAVASKDSYLPEEMLNINGTIKKRLGKIPSNPKIRLVLDNKTYELGNSTFLFSLKLDKNIKSYKHEVKISAEDEFRNIGTTTISFNVIPVPTKLEVLTDKQEYLPNEEATVTINLYDQASDLMEKEAELRIINTNYKTIKKEQVGTKIPFKFKIPEFAVPGEWTLLAGASGLNANADFIVKEFEALDVINEGQIIKIKNIGNVKYLDVVDITAGNTMISKWISLGVNEEKEIDLVNYLDTGNYNINVAGKTFSVAVTNDKNIAEKGLSKIVDFTGGAVLKSEKFLLKNNIPGIFAIFILAGLLIYTMYKGCSLFIKKNKLDNVKMEFSKKEFRPAQRNEPEIEIKSYREKRTPKYSFGHATEADIKDFKKVMFKKVMPEEESRGDYSRRDYYFEKPKERKISYEKSQEPEEKENKGLFSMFD